MIRKFVQFTVLMVIANVAFGQDTTYFDNKWKESDKNSAHYFRVEKEVGDKFERTDYYSSSNQIQMKGLYLSLNPEIKTGEFKWYHSNGKLKHVGEYLENKEIGKHIWYFTNGETEAIENYALGKLNGEFKEYYQNGKVSTETEFSNGEQNGLTKYYREDGSMHSEGNFKNGDRNGEWKYYDESGNLLGINEFKTEYEIEEANMFLKLPNSNWSLTEKIDGEMVQYYFKREPITDKNGINIIPAIMVFVEDATSYEHDVTLYSIWKRKNFMEKGVKIEETLIQDNEEFPLTYKNAYFMKCSYTSQGMEHIFYMIHIINEEQKGIQIYLDMTKDIAGEYEAEFWKTIKSLKQI